MNKKYTVYLHACWLSHLELTEIFEDKQDSKEFYENLSHDSLSKYVKNLDRRNNIVENHRKLKTQYIDTVIEKLWVNIITLHDDEYPENLRNIPHTPFVLYVRWILPKDDMFWVVGARKLSDYGKQVISKIVPDISKVFPIVSGWAAGCDTCAHKSCLNAWNPTVVVVGTGINQTYPAGNEKLFDEIVEKWGAIISIFRIGEPWNPYNFPVRNEIVVWLSKGILIVEAREKSGSLITANLALDIWKDLFSIPWNITSPYSSWTNMLIKKWEAKCVTSSIDVLEEYNIEVKKNEHKTILNFSDELEKSIYNFIWEQTGTIDDIWSKLWIDINTILTKVSLLELKWVIKKDMSWKYILT